MADQGTLNARWAARIMEGLAGSGVENVVISPGSRSSPLALAALRHPGLTAHVLLDERSAAFFALGLAKAGGRPAALVCTSGSAVANWHPAVVEADVGTVPMILLSANRPPELLDCCANQAIDQARLFGSALRAFHALPPADEKPDWLVNLMAQCVLESTWPLAGPVQVDVAFREPLLAKDGAPSPLSGVRAAPELHRAKTAPRPAELEAIARRLEGRRGVVVCGPRPMPRTEIATLAAALDVPVLADPLSGLRFGPHDRSRVMAAYDLFLRRGGFTPDYVLCFGTLPVSKTVSGWLAAHGAERWVVAPAGRWPDPARVADAFVFGDFDEIARGLAGFVEKRAPADWLGAFRAAEDEARAWIPRHEVPEAVMIRDILAALPEDSLLFIGNSMAIRDFDAFSGSAAKNLTVMGNRGASGIDGNLSTFFGAARSGRYAKALALVGDLTFLHDVGGLATAKGDATICVLANGGGVIFDYLAPASLLPPEEYERAWLTPQAANIESAARAFGCAHFRADADGFKAALAESLDATGVSVLEVGIDRRSSARRHRALWEAVTHILEEPS